MEEQKTYIYSTIFDIKELDDGFYVQARDMSGNIIGAGYETNDKIVKSKGTWLKIDSPISYIVQNGIPEVGDIIKIEYTSRPSTGSVTLVSKNEKLSQVKKNRKKGYDTILG